MKNLPTELPVFPLSNFIIFPKTSVPLNIFEPRYIDMVNDSMKSNKLIGMIQPKKSNNQYGIPELYQIGCVGKITSFRETEDGRYLIELKGVARFKNIEEIQSEKKYRILKVNYDNFFSDNSKFKLVSNKKRVFDTSKFEKGYMDKLSTNLKDKKSVFLLHPQNY